MSRQIERRKLFEKYFEKVPYFTIPAQGLESRRARRALARARAAGEWRSLDNIIARARREREMR
jgi:hypothetical protein